MAKGMERVQRLTGEAFQRIRNDHEQFLEAYESESSKYPRGMPTLGVRSLLHRWDLEQVTEMRP